MDVLPLVPVGLLVVVVAWLIWPVIQDAFREPKAPAVVRGGDNDEMAEVLFDVWNAHGDRPGLVTANVTS